MKNIFDPIDSFGINKQVPSFLKWGNPALHPEPAVSVLMPVYNHPRFFRQALLSALQQEYAEPYEVVIVDNNDDSETATEYEKTIADLKDQRVLYYRNKKNIGMLGNWNRCIELARSPFITYLHDDDMLLPTALTTLMRIQKQHGSKAIFSAYNVIDENGRYKKAIDTTPFYKRNLFFLKRKQVYKYTLFDQFLHSAGFGVGCLFSRDKMLKIGGYNQEYYPSADYALQILYTYLFGSVYSAVPVFNYRIAENETNSIYTRFADTDRFFRNCIKSKLHIPLLMADRILAANYTTSRIHFEKVWGPTEKTASPPITDKLLMKLVDKLTQLKQFSL